MNHVFSVVWNRALNQWVVASELCRARTKSARSVIAAPSAAFSRLGAGVMLAVLGLTTAQAHTISIGYENSGDRALTFWYGTYHAHSETTYTEGSLRLQGPNGLDTTLPFALLTDNKPTGLVDGDTNFYNNGHGALGGINLDPRGEPANWQGLQFTNLFAGTYTFTYVPIANPTQVWAPESPVILSSSVTIITADLSTAPRIEAGQVVNETQVGDPLLFDGGTLRIDQDTVLPQVVSLTNKGGTLDTNGHELTLNGDIDGRGDMIKDGDGTLFIRGDNTNTGNLVINEGIVNVVADSNLGAPDSDVIFNGGTLQWGAQFDLGNARDIVLDAGGGTLDTQANDTRIDQAITGTGDLTKTGTGTLEFGGANTYTGDTTIDEGTLALTGNGSLANSSQVVVGSGATLDVSGGNTDAAIASLGGNGGIVLGNHDLVIGNGHGDFGGTIDGNGGVQIVGGTQALTGNNTFDGDLVVGDNATLVTGDDASLGQGTLVLGDNATLVANGSLNTDNAIRTDGAAIIDSAGHDVQLGGDIGGNGGLTKTGEGTLVLSGQNGFDGDLVIDNGTVQVSSDAQVGNGSVVIDNDGRLQAGADLSIDNGVVLLSSDATVDTDAHEVTLDGGVTGAGTLNKSGTGTLVLDGTNTFGGGLDIDAGTVRANTGDALGTGTIHIGDGSLQAGGDLVIGNDLVLAHAGSTIDTGTHDVAFDGTIGGNGGLTKTGSGTLELNGTGSYAGDTTIDDGTLALSGDAVLGNGAVINHGTLDISAANNGANIVSLTGDGEVALGGNDLTLSNASGSFDGHIDGTGSVIVTGGTQALTGDNGFSGGLVVAGGTVQVSSDASLGTGTVSIGNGVLQTIGGFTSDNDFALTSTVATIDTDGHDVTFNGNLSGNGSLNKVGDGTLTLRGENSQDGLNVRGGTVEFASDASLGRDGSVVTIADNTTLRSLDSMTITHEIFVDNTRSAVFDTNGHDIVVAGDIGGSGIVQKLGGGVLTLSGKNSQVLMQVQGGSIAVTSQEAAGAIGGDIYIGQDGNFTALSAMNVTQNVHVTGDNARFETRGANVMLTGTLDGSHCLIKAGNGRLDMRSNGSNAIGACIEEGELAFNSTFGGNVWVYADGTASGSGRIDGAMDVRGVLAPGNSPGVLVVNGDVVQHAGSVFVADIDGRTAGNGAGHHDQLRLVGADSVYTAGGELQPLLRGIAGAATNTFVPDVGDSFVLVQAEGGVTGSYASLTQPQVGLAANTRFDVRYDANAVVLTVTPNLYANAMTTRNSAAVGASIDALRAASGVRRNDDAGRLQSSLMGMTVAQMASAFEQIDGEFHATTRGVLADDARRVRDAALDRMRGGRSPVADGEDAGDAVWGQVLASGGSLDSDGNAGAADYNGSGLLLGAEHRFGNGWQLGVMGGSERTDMEVASRASSGDADTLHLGLYADRSWGAFDLRAGVGVAEHSIDSARVVALPGLSQRLIADYDAQTRQVYVEGGYTIEGLKGSLQPYVQYARVETENDAFSETGGSLALDVASDTTALDVSTVGVRGELSLTSEGTANGWFNLRGGLGWRHVSGDLASTTRMGWNGGADFSVDGTPLAKDAAVVELGVAAWLSKRTLLELGYEGQYADEGRDHQATARLSIRF
ncbi:autotransporter domain-containing protein [Lysobacter panacisoli]|uniref:Autotransporter domain-containing protein n=1 Tax=Lysobacter panacisoli TaxID=1255263 RepID=A0ABP9LPW7_9GAMM|nr:autotransporter domain-containing protein [Lysobacter panacisoli]